MCRDDRHAGILLPAAPELHPVPSPPDAILDEPGADTGTAPDAPLVSQLEAMLDEPEADTSTAPDASPAMKLRLLQSLGVPEQEPATLRSDTPLSKQAEHSPQQAESSLLPSDALHRLGPHTLHQKHHHYQVLEWDIHRPAYQKRRLREMTPPEKTPSLRSTTLPQEADSTRVTVNPEPKHWCLPHGN